MTTNKNTGHEKKQENTLINQEENNEKKPRDHTHGINMQKT